jgi:hypothetical protein
VKNNIPLPDGDAGQREAQAHKAVPYQSVGQGAQEALGPCPCQVLLDVIKKITLNTSASVASMSVYFLDGYNSLGNTTIVGS